MSLEACLPLDLQRPDTRITSIADGISGAEVYRVDAGDRAFVLKIAAGDEDPVSWHRALTIRRRAAAAGLTPDVIHVDEGRRAVLTQLVVDRSFSAVYRDPASHDTTLAQLGQALRRLHALPLPPESESPGVPGSWAARATAPRDLLETSWAALTAADIAVPAFVTRAAQGVLTETPPESERARVLSHNDVHPRNLVHDGTTLYLMDWDASGPNDPFYDLATIAVFLGMDAVTCRRLVAAYDDAPECPLPERFLYLRRLIAVLCGVGFIQFGHQGGYRAGADAAGEQTLEAPLTLGEFYQQMRAGTLSLATGEGRWAFGVALVRETLAPMT